MSLEAALAQDKIEYVVQVNGKVRARLQIAADADRPTIEARARENENVLKFTRDKEIRKIIRKAQKKRTKRRHREGPPDHLPPPDPF